MNIWQGIQRPSEKMHEVLTGQLHYELAQPAIQSACRLQIYEGACEILRLPDKETRRKALDKLPALIRPYVEEEAMRLWRTRNDV